MLAAALFVLAGPGRAEAYRFYSLSDADPIVTAAEAIRWDTADFPLRYHVQDNIPDFLDEATWRDIVAFQFNTWTTVRTAAVGLTLEPGLVEGDGADGRDERLTIGWVSGNNDFSGRATVWYSTATGRALDCDIEMNADVYREWLDEGDARSVVLARMRRTVLHEVGHCLGLDHTEPHPMPGWLPFFRGTPQFPSGFLPETVMSHAAFQTENLAEDDRIGVSVLYPASGFAASRGAVAGRLVRDAGTVRSDVDAIPFAYVQAVYLGSDPRMGPGAFSDGDGYFHLEGLEHGAVLLWIHPILIHFYNAHGALLEKSHAGGGLDVLDQWQWVRATRGRITVMPEIVLATGRTR